MDNLQEDLQSRQAIYRILGRIYRVEADKELFARLREIAFPSETGNKDLDQGFSELKGILAGPDPDFDFLAADYARTFLAAGIARGQVAFPYESVYTSPQRIIKQDAYEAVYRILCRHGLASSAEDVYPDHIGIELEFMGFLCGKALEALRAGDMEKASGFFDEQKEFLEKHLLNWTTEFTADIAHWAELPFYQAVGKITRGFLALEREYFSRA